MRASWVFTRDELRSLTRTPAYKQLMVATLASFSNIFVGMSVDDIAVGGHLEALAKLGGAYPTHFWLTSRTDAATDTWAEGLGVRVIRYNSVDGHEECVSKFFTALAAATPGPEIPAPPVFGPPVRVSPGALPEPGHCCSC